jgi:hypothetical protein
MATLAVYITHTAQTHHIGEKPDDIVHMQKNASLLQTAEAQSCDRANTCREACRNTTSCCKQSLRTHPHNHPGQTSGSPQLGVCCTAGTHPESATLLVCDRAIRCAIAQAEAVTHHIIGPAPACLTRQKVAAASLPRTAGQQQRLTTRAHHLECIHQRYTRPSWLCIPRACRHAG